jgi:hypothetical protein
LTTEKSPANIKEDRVMVFCKSPTKNKIMTDNRKYIIRGGLKISDFETAALDSFEMSSIIEYFPKAEVLGKPLYIN